MSTPEDARPFVSYPPRVRRRRPGRRSRPAHGPHGAGRRAEARQAAEHFVPHGRPAPRRLPGQRRQPGHRSRRTWTASPPKAPVPLRVHVGPFLHAGPGGHPHRPLALASRHAGLRPRGGALPERTAAHDPRGGLLHRGHRQDALPPPAQHPRLSQTILDESGRASRRTLSATTASGSRRSPRT